MIVEIKIVTRKIYEWRKNIVTVVEQRRKFPILEFGMCRKIMTT
jgi:hypothetical protein